MGRKGNLAWQRSELEELRRAIHTAHPSPADGSHHIVVVGPKGGTGKTTTAAMLASILASSRGEIVAVLDATHQLGTLRRRLVPLSTAPTRPFHELCQRALNDELASEWSVLAPYVDAVGTLRVLRSCSSSMTEPTLSSHEFIAGVALLRRAASIVVSDMGTKANGPVTTAALDCADTLVIATDPSYDALELTIEMVSALAGEPLSYRPDPDDWDGLSNGRFASLVAHASVVVVSPSRSTGDTTLQRDPNLSMMLEWLRVVCGGGVVLVPCDDQLSRGDFINADELDDATILAYTRLAASVASERVS